jgi:hypothetical protein
MANFDTEAYESKQIAPKSFESPVHTLFRDSPVEVDLTQPNRAKRTSFEQITGYANTILVAEVNTPVDHVGVLYTKFSDYDAMLTLVGKHPNSATIVGPGESVDLSEKPGEGNFIIEMDASSKRVLLRTNSPDDAYTFETRQLEVFKAPSFEQNSDDPEIDPEAIYTISKS